MDLPDNVLDALRRGRKIEAIKLLRKQRGIGLKEAKDAVDQSFTAGCSIVCCRLLAPCCLHVLNNYRAMMPISKPIER